MNREQQEVTKKMNGDIEAFFDSRREWLDTGGIEEIDKQNFLELNKFLEAKFTEHSAGLGLSEEQSENLLLSIKSVEQDRLEKAQNLPLGYHDKEKTAEQIQAEDKAIHVMAREGIAYIIASDNKSKTGLSSLKEGVQKGLQQIKDTLGLGNSQERGV